MWFFGMVELDINFNSEKITTPNSFYTLLFNVS